MVSKIVTTDKGQNIGMKSLIVFISLLMGIATSSFAQQRRLWRLYHAKCRVVGQVSVDSDLGGAKQLVTQFEDVVAVRIVDTVMSNVSLWGDLQIENHCVRGFSPAVLQTLGNVVFPDRKFGRCRQIIGSRHDNTGSGGLRVSSQDKAKSWVIKP